MNHNSTEHHYKGWSVVEMEETPLYFEDAPDWVDTKIIDIVTVTIYNAVSAQCDDTPNILADGTMIDVSRAGEYRYCALSRDLLARWGGRYQYGDTISINGAGNFSGKWVVKDTMNKRFTNRVDLLVDEGTRLYKYEYASLRKF
jgi:3D (Asp-Asp-Asp) domain-containing protein